MLYCKHGATSAVKRFFISKLTRVTILLARPYPPQRPQTALPHGNQVSKCQMLQGAPLIQVVTPFDHLALLARARAWDCLSEQAQSPRTHPLKTLPFSVASSCQELLRQGWGFFSPLPPQWVQATLVQSPYSSLAVSSCVRFYCHVRHKWLSSFALALIIFMLPFMWVSILIFITEKRFSDEG